MHIAESRKRVRWKIAMNKKFYERRKRRRKRKNSTSSLDTVFSAYFFIRNYIYT